MRNEIRLFEKLLKQNSRSVMGDAFIRAYIDDLLKNIRTQVRPKKKKCARARAVATRRALARSRPRLSPV